LYAELEDKNKAIAQKDAELAGKRGGTEEIRKLV
jgi:hypothetical protein